MDAEAMTVWFDEAEDGDKAVNRARAAALKRMHGCVYRCHSDWDLAPEIGIRDALIEALGMGTMYGGFGQMFNSSEAMATLGVEAIIAGECCDYTLRNAEELGMAVIEAGHCASENPGMRALARWLAKKLPEIRVAFVDTGRPWRYPT